MRFGNNHMDKLNLPIPGELGPPTYENQTLLFERTGDIFDLCIGSPQEIIEWKRLSMECELLDRVTFRTQAEARRAVFQFIEGWYNPHRLHSSLGYMSPIQYELARSNLTSMPSGQVSTKPVLPHIWCLIMVGGGGHPKSGHFDDPCGMRAA
jgi:hypothetical protein